MRVIAACMLAAVGSIVLMRSSQDLRNRYGEPDRERFAVQPKISLTVEYGSDHLACSALIDPPQPLANAEENVPLMPSDAVTELLEEFVPLATRGEKINAILNESGCNKIHTTDYENVSVTRATHTCEPSSPDQDVRTIVTFKRDICRKIETASPVSRRSRNSDAWNDRTVRPTR